MSQKMKKPIEYFDKLRPGMPPITIAWHARGNQGAVAATEIVTILCSHLVELGFPLDETSAPIFGAAKEGEPIRIYQRISYDKIEVFYTPTALDVIVIVDPTISRNILLQGAHKDTVFVVNTRRSPDRVARELKLGPARLITVDATGIAKEIIKSKRSHPNTVMLGAFSWIFPFFPTELFENSIVEKFHEKGEKIANANVSAFNRGKTDAVQFDGRDFNIPWEATASAPLRPWNEVEPGCAVPATANFTVNKTGTWRTERPVYFPEKCIHCLACKQACSDYSILTKINQNGEEKMVGIDYDHCKGCAACVTACPVLPVKALSMIPETEAEVQK